MLLTLSLGIASLPGMAAGFHVSGQKLLDANDNEFVMRGCNYSYAWQSGHEWSVIPAAKRIGCNAIRIQLGDGARFNKTSAQTLQNLINLCEDNKLIAIFNTHDETGSDNASDLYRAVDYWIEMKDILNAHTSTVLVNISNEWCGSWDTTLWASAYKEAIARLRKAGLKNTLVVDAAGWGQFPKCVQSAGWEVAAADTDHNLIFSVHIYDDAGKNDYTAQQSIDYVLSAGVPAIVGEFAYRHHYNDVAYQKVLDYCAAKNVGYLVWSWTGNGSGAEDCDMFGSYDDSQWKQNGTLTVKGPNGIQATAKECSIFSPNSGGGDNSGGNNGDSEGNEKNEITIATPGIRFSTWNDEPYHIPAEKFKTAQTDDVLRIYYTADAGAEIQLAYVDAASSWTETIPYKGINGSGHEDQSLTRILDDVKRGGFFVKGHGYRLDKVTLITSITGGDPVAAVGGIPADISDQTPCEIYTLQGMRVSETLPGHIYIIRQGQRSYKIMK